MEAISFSPFLFYFLHTQLSPSFHHSDHRYSSAEPRRLLQTGQGKQTRRDLPLHHGSSGGETAPVLLDNVSAAARAVSPAIRCPTQHQSISSARRSEPAWGHPPVPASGHMTRRSQWSR